MFEIVNFLKSFFRNLSYMKINKSADRTKYPSKVQNANKEKNTNSLMTNYLCFNLFGCICQKDR